MLSGHVPCVVNVLGEVKNLSAPHDLRSGRDVYVVAALDQEEIFRTATVERSLKYCHIVCYYKNMVMTFQSFLWRGIQF